MKSFQRVFLLLLMVLRIMPLPVYGEEGSYRLYDHNGSYEETFEDRSSAFSAFEQHKEEANNLVLAYEDQIIRMEYGIVEFLSSEACDLSIEYDSLSKSETDYINGCYGADALYLDSDQNGSVSFLISGDEGRTKIENLILHPYTDGMILSKYQVKDEKLIHKIATQLDYDFYTYTITLDDAPSFLKEGEEYFSYDGHYFFDDFYAMADASRSNSYETALNDQPYYDYYQFLPHRSYTDYSLDEIESYFSDVLKIDGRLNHYEDRDGDGAADEINRSQLYGNYNEFFAMEKLYGCNAMMLLSSAINESSYGRDHDSYSLNSLYSALVFESDEDRENGTYSNIADSIYAHAKYFISSRYSNYRRDDYKGTYYGNKASGMNVNYSIDPYYGEKSASVYCELDRKLGLKDKDKYALAIVNADERISFYKDAAMESRLFSLYGIHELSFIVLEEGEDYYKIRVDASFSSDYLYDPEASVAYIPKERVLYLINAQGIHEESFDHIELDLDEGTYHGLKDISLLVKDDKTIPILPEKEGYDFINFDEDNKAIYKKIRSIDLNGRMKTDYLQGQDADLRGGILEITYEDLSKEELQLNSDHAKLTEESLNVFYKGLETTKPITYSERLAKTYAQLSEAIEKDDAKTVKKLISDIDAPLSFSKIRAYDSALREDDLRNYVIFDESGRYDLSISGLDLSLEDKRSLSLLADTYYVIVDDIKEEDKEEIYGLAKGYGFDMVEGIDISFRFNYQSIGLSGPAIVQIDVQDKATDKIYSVYHLNSDGDIVKCRTTQTDRYIQFLIEESGPYLVLTLESVNTYDLSDGEELLGFENMGYDKHKTNFELMGTIVMSLTGLIGITLYYIVYNERKRMWKDFRRSLQQAGTVQEEKPKN